MELRPLCRMSMRYAQSSWHRPYAGNQGVGFGSGTGAVTGETLNGELIWANYAQRWEDGVWCPSVRGYLTTADAAEIVVAGDTVARPRWNQQRAGVDHPRNDSFTTSTACKHASTGWLMTPRGQSHLAPTRLRPAFAAPASDTEPLAGAVFRCRVDTPRAPTSHWRRGS